MKKTIIISMLAAFSAVGANAQRIAATASVVDMGQVQFYSPTSGTFDLKNTSNKSLKITKVDTGCGCTVATYPTGTIGGGDKFTIKVTYDARMLGHFDKVIDVYTSGSDVPLRLDLRGVVVEEVEDFKGNFPFQLGNYTADCNYIEFEDVRQGEVFQQKFHIYNPTSKEVQPTIMHLPNYLKADISPSRVKPGRSAEVTITLDSRNMHEYGLVQTQVYLGNMGDKVAANKEIGISTVLLPSVEELSESERAMAPKIEISTTQLDLSSTDGKKRSETIDIMNSGKSRLEIRSIQMFTPGLQVQLNKTVLEPGEYGKLKISTDPKQLKNLKTQPRVLMVTNDPDMPKVIIDINI